ncbi:MAG: uL15 family ribosomal protein [Candidatus Pacebacteria bacterium]|jgi:large subunit ribosomal protein L15|nr:uL15 family ribosomal protein [Candidatus Paceibacterota bacterium]
MQIHELQSNPKNRKRKLVGRGGKRGKTSGRGTKGQNARAGRKKRPEMRDRIKKLPKQRGRGKNSNKSVWTKPVIVRLGEISKLYKADEKVTPQTLVAKGICKSLKGSAPAVKILGTGELDKKLIFKGVDMSASVKAAIEKIGGAVK